MNAHYSTSYLPDGSFAFASYYASSMVLQRATPENPDLQTNVWGPSGQVGDLVEVVFDGNIYTVEAYEGRSSNERKGMTDVIQT